MSESTKRSSSVGTLVGVRCHFDQNLIKVLPPFPSPEAAKVYVEAQPYDPDFFHLIEA